MTKQRLLAFLLAATVSTAALAGAPDVTGAAWMSSGTVCGGLCDPLKDADVKPAKFGLQRLGFNKHWDISEAARDGMSQRDIYFLRDAGGSLKTVILCTAEEAKTDMAQCEHKFIDEKLNALVSVHYRRVYLQNWREVEAAWRKLLESFIELRVTNPHH